MIDSERTASNHSGQCHSGAQKVDEPEDKRVKAVLNKVRGRKSKAYDTIPSDLLLPEGPFQNAEFTHELGSFPILHRD